MTPDIVGSILSFWFEEGIAPGLCEYRPVWFESTPDIDRQIEERFRSTFEKAAAGELDHWAGNAPGSLALVIALDQFPRNLFRDGPRAFATDEMAKSIAVAAIEQGHDLALPPLRRIFIYLPFQHSESLEDQALSIKLFDSLGKTKVFHFVQDAARGHREIIARFGRFPHRNTVLGREPTREEGEFLANPEGKFWTA
jgi:uncharacterized protein (DUF924 family)